jgi:hypothetical protein
MWMFGRFAVSNREREFERVRERRLTKTIKHPIQYLGHLRMVLYASERVCVYAARVSDPIIRHETVLTREREREKKREKCEKFRFQHKDS